MIPAGAPRPARETAALAVATFSLVGYFLIARVVGNVYPFSTFPMYSGRHAPSGSRIVAKDVAGGLHEVTDGEAWECDSGALSARGCVDDSVYYIGYVDREAIDFVRAHAGPDPRAAPVELVRHIWSFPADRGPPMTRDCILGRCRAVLK